MTIHRALKGKLRAFLSVFFNALHHSVLTSNQSPLSPFHKASPSVDETNAILESLEMGTSAAETWLYEDLTDDLPDSLEPEWYCSCAIFRGESNRDPIFQYFEEEVSQDYTDDGYDDYSRGEEKAGSDLAGFIALDYFEDGDMDFFGLLDF